jgi:hypothetical protein
LLNRLAVKHLNLPIDIHDHQEYGTYAENNVNNLHNSFSERFNARRKKLCKWRSSPLDEIPLPLDRLMRILLYCLTIAQPIADEISYRYLLETIVLPCICPQFAVFSTARTCVSSLLFAAKELHNNHDYDSQEKITGHFLNKALLGVICSLAQQRIGLIGAIFVHIGYNLHGYQYDLNENLTKLIKRIRKTHLIETIGFIAMTSLCCLLCNAASPFQLTYQAAKKIYENKIRLGF